MKLDGGIYTGPQPKDYSDYRIGGFKTVINLQTGWFESLCATEDRELIECYKNGIIFYDFCLSNFFPPTTGQVSTILQILKNSRWPLYIHCRHGHERTGFMMAVYRMQAQNWPFEKAYVMWRNDFKCHWPWYWLWKKELRAWEKR